MMKSTLSKVLRASAAVLAVAACFALPALRAQEEAASEAPAAAEAAADAAAPAADAALEAAETVAETGYDRLSFIGPYGLYWLLALAGALAALYFAFKFFGC